MPHLRLHLLGPPRVELDGEPVHIGRTKAVALLAYLAVTARSHTRDALATLFWPEYDQRDARADLRRTLSVLNRSLGKGWVTADRETAGLYRDADPSARLQETQPEGSRRVLWLDVDEFHRRMAACESHDHPAWEACSECLALLTEAVELYRDDFLAGFTLPGSLAFDEWQFFQTEGLRDALAGALERLVGCHSAQGEIQRAIAYARRWLELDPLNEPAHRCLMELYVQVGRQGAALRQFRKCARLLEKELGVPPSVDTTTLYERIQNARLVRDEKRPAPIPMPAVPYTPRPVFLTEETRPTVVERPVFVAREQELARLSRYLDMALVGQGKVVFVTGGPGRGKTALMREFARRTVETRPDLLVASGSCNAYSGVGDPYLPFRELMDMLTGDVEGRWKAGAVTGEQARRLWAALPLTAQALVDHGPSLIDIFFPGSELLARAAAVASGTPDWLARLNGLVQRWRAGHSDLEQRALFTQFTSTLCALAAQHPLMLTLDDIQWADTGSIGLLFHLGRRLAGSRVLIACAYRPEEVAPGYPLEKVLAEFKRRFGDVWIDLARADEMEGRRFIDAILDTRPNRLGGAFRSAMFQRTGGHPLFTVELVRAMQERGDLVQDADANDAWVEGPALDWETLPPRVEAVIETRVARLDEELFNLLAVASVEGERFTAQVVAQVQDIPAREVLHALSQELGARHRLVREAAEVQVAGSDRFLCRYRFAHTLFQEYLYNGLSAGDRRLLHGKIAAALETLYAGHTAEIVTQFAHHYTKAGQAEKAIAYLLRAGIQARRAHANEEALDYLQRGLALLDTSSPAVSPVERLDESYEDWRREIGTQLCEHFGDLLELTGQHDRARAAYREALAHVPAADRAWIVRLLRLIGNTFKSQGRYDEALRAYGIAESSLELDPASTDTRLWREWVEIQFSRMLLYYGKGDADKMLALAERTRPVVERYGSFAHRAELCRLNSQMHARRERYVISDRVLAWSERAVALCQEIGDDSRIAYSRFWLGFCHLWRGDYDRAGQNLQVALKLANRVGFQEVQTLCLSYLALLHRMLGYQELARRYSTQCLSLSGMEQMPTYIGLAKANLAWLAWRAGNLDEALEKGRGALKLWQGSVYPFQWTALWPSIGTALALDRVSDAIDCARALLDPTQQRLPDELSAAVEEVIHAWDSGRRDTACTGLDQAVVLAQEMAYL